MKINLICVGSVKDAALGGVLSRYVAKLPYYMPFELTAIPDVKAPRSVGAEAQKQREGEAILARTAPADFVVLFDERGRELTSRELAEFIGRKASVLPRNLVFVIGGPYGFSKEVYARADMQLSLSRMTFTHEMAIVIAAEQLYRAQTILRGEPYHHD